MALSFFLRLILGHVLGDYVLQPYWLVLAKRNGWKGLLIHVGVVALITGLLVWDSIVNWWAWIIILYFGHLLIDQFRTFIFTDNTKGKGLLLLTVDQLIHLVFLMILAWAATGWQISELKTLITGQASDQHRLIVYLTGLAFVIGVVPVMEAEITVAVWAAQGYEVKRTVQIDVFDRLMGSLERIIAILLIVFGYGFLSPFMFLPRFGLMVYRGQIKVSRAAVITKIMTSFATSIIIGYLLYNIPFPFITL